jgi:SAM-dependent methyltransferase
MEFMDIVDRKLPESWEEANKLPWDDPDFSRRMLREHLSQEHDDASRRYEVIDRHVEWIHHSLLDGEPSRVLDLGCGPGLYTSRLAKLGHECVGIDFSPASIEYAIERSHIEGHHCTYRKEDIREANFGSGYGLVMLNFGELNMFRRADAVGILESSHDALEDGGVLLLEPHTFEGIRMLGGRGKSWYAAETGVFSDRPYICLEENLWDAQSRTTTTRFFIIEAETGHVERYGQTFQAFTEEEYERILQDSGYGDVRTFPSLSGEVDESQSLYFALVAMKMQEV